MTTIKSADKHSCAKLVYGSSHLFGGSPCSRRGVVERNGKWWCKQHDPEAVAARAAAREVRWGAEAEAKEAVRLAAVALTERLGAGKPDYSWVTGKCTGGVVLSASEAERLIARLERAEGHDQ